MPPEPPAPPRKGQRPQQRPPARPESGVRPAAEQLLALADEVTQRGAQTRRQLDELEVALAQLRRRQSGEPKGRRARPSRESAATGEETIRLVVVEMAAAGFSRDEVSAHLSDDFGVPDARAALDEVFGAES